MIKYHKINSIFKRNRKTGKFIMDEFAQPEFEYLQDNEWTFTEKVDGMNIRLGWSSADPGVVHIGGRSDNAQLPVPLFEYLGDTFTPERMDATFLRRASNGTVITLFGEGYGRKIQKVGSSYLPDSVGFILFDVLVGNWWLEREAVNGIAASLGVPVVANFATGSLWKAIEYVKAAPKSIIGDCVMEGLVLRPVVEMYNRGRNRIITKVKVKDFAS